CVDELLIHIEALAEKVFDRLQHQQLLAKTIGLKVKYANFKQVTRSFTQTDALTNAASVKPILKRLLNRTDAGRQAVRLVGVTASGFEQQGGEKDAALDKPETQLNLQLK
ncbi:MAG: hypothetical protein R8K53_01350, partial [Mariprofundaceae bacterium]